MSYSPLLFSLLAVLGYIIIFLILWKVGERLEARERKNELKRIEQVLFELVQAGWLEVKK